jgi:hypothetical protein
MAGAAVEMYLDNKIVQQSVTEQIACRKDILSLRYWPVVSLDSVVIDETDVVDDWNTRTSDGVTWVIESRSHSYFADEQISVTYTAGYDPLPGPVGYAIAETAGNYYKKGGGVGDIKKEVVQGVGSVEYVTSEDSESAVGPISGRSLAVLEMYRRWHV